MSYTIINMGTASIYVLASFNGGPGINFLLPATFSKEEILAVLDKKDMELTNMQPIKGSGVEPPLRLELSDMVGKTKEELNPGGASIE